MPVHNNIGAEPMQEPVHCDLLPFPHNNGKAFELPSFGGLHDLITSGKPLTSSVQRKIVDLLFHAMLKYTVVPTRDFYARVTHLLLQKYPQLTDVVGTGSDSWKVSLRYKFKNQRRRLSEDPLVAENKRKFGSQRKQAQGFTSTELKRHTRPKLDIKHTAILGEDDTTLAAHEEWLLAEAKKGDPDESGIRERMTLTTKSRLQSIRTMKIEDVKKLYPYMMQPERFIEDFKRLIRSDVTDCISRGIDATVALVRQEAVACNLLSLAALKIIALNVKEPKAFHMFVQEGGQDMPITPCVLYSGESIEDADYFYLVVERKRLFFTCNAEGLIVLLGAYWLFNLCYSSDAFNTLVVLERLYLKMNVTTPRTVVTKFLNKVVKKHSVVNADFQKLNARNRNQVLLFLVSSKKWLSNSV
ncbi:uncharacterized protein LOC144094405 [Amblyomma americanum]